MSRLHGHGIKRWHSGWDMIEITSEKTIENLAKFNLLFMIQSNFKKSMRCV